ncbi:hypothetical protein [Cytobacillus oceanisediminis]|uniref:hypothetical protein n=1 Tax=Cytobacillus oceanisediminis TaxID=665099 RepID=UPI001FB4E22E|nr:hypothetical protein [Cytobacillus oceanisediminis]UOE58051.1 hypothetical protein IRB79_27695 [Cytobacillus oceanisediminis]
MRLEKKHKPSFHKANARYRGVTEHNQYTNFVLETAHDLVLLINVTKGNQHTQQEGHEKEIYNNFVSVMTGDKEVGKSNLFTASTLQKIDKSRNVPVPGMEGWSSIGGCTVTKSGDSFMLTSQGLIETTGMFSPLYVEPGDKIYIRLKVKSGAGAPYFSFGSNNLRTVEQTGNTKKVEVSAGADYILVDHVLRCHYTEAIQLNINLHESPEFLQPTSVEIKDLEIHYFQETSVAASSFDTSIKPSVDAMEEKINSIR